MAITITTPTTCQIFQRQSNGYADILISGTSTALGSIRARLNGGSWQTIGSVVSGVFTGTLKNQTGQGTLEVENTTNGDTSSVAYVGVGSIIIAGGQSNNSMGSSDNDQVSTHATLKSGVITNNGAGWQELTNFKSHWCIVASHWMAAFNEPLGIVMTAVGSTSLAVGWNPNTPGPQYVAAVDRINTSGINGALCIDLDLGENDAIPSVNTSRPTWFTLFGQLKTALSAAIGRPDIPWVVHQTGTQGDNNNAIRLAQMDVWDNVPGVLRGITQYDRRAIHWETNTEIAIQAGRKFLALARHFKGQNYPLPPRLKSTRLSGTTTVVLNFDAPINSADSDLAEAAITLTNTGGTARTTSTFETRGKAQAAVIFSGAIDGQKPYLDYASHNTASNFVTVPRSPSVALPVNVNSVPSVYMPVVPFLVQPIDADVPLDIKELASEWYDANHPTLGMYAERIKGALWTGIAGTPALVSGRYGYALEVAGGTGNSDAEVVSKTRDNAAWYDSERQSYLIDFEYTPPVSGVSSFTRVWLLDGASQIYLRISDQTGGSFTRKIEFVMNGILTLSSADNFMSTAGWYQVVITMDKVKREVKLYVNGTLIATGTPASFNTLANNTLQLGRNSNIQTLNFGVVAAWAGVVLSQDQVTRINNATRGCRWGIHRYAIPDLSPVDNALHVRGVGHSIQLSCYSAITGQLIAISPSTVSVTVNRDGAGAVAATNAPAQTTVDGVLSLVLTAAEANAVRTVVSATSSVLNVTIKAPTINYRDYITRSDLPELSNLDQTISSRATPADVNVEVTVDPPEVGNVVLAASQPNYAPATAADVANAIGSLAGQPLEIRELIDKNGVIRIVRGDDYKDQRRIPIRDKGKWSDLTDATLRFTAKYTDGHEITGTPTLEMDGSTQVVWVELVHSQTEVADRTEDWWSYDLEATLDVSNDVETLELGRMQIAADITRPAA